MPDKQSRAECTARIAGCRLDPNLFKRAFAQNASVPNAVEGDTAGEDQVLHSGFAMSVLRHVQHDLFRDSLDRRCKVHLTLRDFRFWFASWRAKETMELFRGHRQALAIVEVAH